MKKRIILFIIGLVLVGGIAAGFVVLDHPRFRGARWDSWHKVWEYFPERARRPLKISFDMTKTKKYRDEVRKFSFQYPSRWKLESLDNGKDLDFYVVRDSILWAPERQRVLSLTVNEWSEADYLANRGRGSQGRYVSIEKKRTEFYGGLPWLIYDLPVERWDHGIYPYPKGVLEFGDWRLIVNHFRPEIFGTFRYEGKLEIVGYEPPPRIVPFVQYGSYVDSTNWQSIDFEDFGLTFKYPREWRKFQFIKSDTPEDIWRKDKLFGPQKGRHYSAFLTEGKISIYLFTDDYNGWEDEGSQYFYPSITLNDSETVFEELQKYFSFFDGSIMEDSSLGKGKVIRAFEDRGYGLRNVAVTYFIPHIKPNLNIYIVVDLNDPMDLDVTGKPYISSADLRQLLNDKKVQDIISLSDEIVRNISIMQ